MAKVPNTINSEPYPERTKGGTSFAGSDVDIFVLAVLASGLRLYAKTGMMPNRNYTPAKMLRAAAAYTHKSYRRGQYEEAAQDLTAMAEAQKRLPRLQ